MWWEAGEQMRARLDAEREGRDIVDRPSHDEVCDGCPDCDPGGAA